MIAHVFAWSHFHALHIPINYTNSARNPVTQYIPLWNDKNPPGNNPATWIMDMEVYGYSVYSYDSVVCAPILLRGVLLRFNRLKQVRNTVALQIPLVHIL